MKITLSPSRRDDALDVIVAGDVLILNGEVLDFAPLQEGSTLPQSAVGNQWIIGDVTRKDGEIELTLILPNAHDASQAARFPEPITVTTGKVELPV